MLEMQTRRNNHMSFWVARHQKKFWETSKHRRLVSKQTISAKLGKSFSSTPTNRQTTLCLSDEGRGYLYQTLYVFKYLLNGVYKHGQVCKCCSTIRGKMSSIQVRHDSTKYLLRNIELPCTSNNCFSRFINPGEYENASLELWEMSIDPSLSISSSSVLMMDSNLMLLSLQFSYLVLHFSCQLQMIVLSKNFRSVFRVKKSSISQKSCNRILIQKKLYTNFDSICTHS